MILIIDDDRERMVRYARYLMLEGYKIITAWSEGEALRKIERFKEKINCIILDSIMPSQKYNENETKKYRFTGLILLKNDIRPILPDVPVILFSIIKENELLEFLGDENIAAVLRKPSTPPEKLVEIIKNTISIK